MSLVISDIESWTSFQMGPFGTIKQRRWASPAITGNGLPFIELDFEIDVSPTSGSLVFGIYGKTPLGTWTDPAVSPSASGDFDVFQNELSYSQPWDGSGPPIHLRVFAYAGDERLHLPPGDFKIEVLNDTNLTWGNTSYCHYRRYSVSEV